MISINPKSKEAERCMPNLLPCRINHDGPVNATDRFWKPTVDQDGKQTAYFRGRKLLGKEVKIPDHYEGAVVRITKEVISKPQDPSNGTSAEEDGEDDDFVETFAGDKLASFDQFTVWKHEASPDAADDPYVRGIEEWITFAETMHSTSSETESTPQKVPQ